MERDLAVVTPEEVDQILEDEGRGIAR